ncbi:hypothetical protein [Nannocystis sp.]|uniref:hypothetical protein n=1 Tax=Nannocystis sp. TaxID=1962667 RepID=UPI0025F16844|nr:hypothetical protein [Nannocystis sp.]MBK7825576.1 hypothetical protein [Nannocystis sp.]
MRRSAPRIASWCLLVLACGDNRGGSSSNATLATTTEATTDTDGSATASPTSTGPTTDPTSGPPGTYCQERCTADIDCQIAGTDIGSTCENGTCTEFSPNACAIDFECTVVHSEWLGLCVAQAECPMGYACARVDELGRCAPLPGQRGCMAGTQELMVPPYEGGADITVCGVTGWTCDGGTCINPCESDADCGSTHRPHCSAGDCVCQSDAECMTQGAAACIDGRCGCNADDQCISYKSDTCFAGQCGCSSVAVCPEKVFHDGTMWVCEGL